MPKPDKKIPKLDPAIFATNGKNSVQQQNIKSAIHSVKKYKVIYRIIKKMIFVK